MMKNVYKIMITSCIAALLFIPCSINSKFHQNTTDDVYQDTPQLFQAENDMIGTYWCKERNRPAKAYIGDNEFINIVVIKTKQLETKHAKKLRKHKEYLGTYLSPKTNLQYNLYGINKNPIPFDDGPDSDVRTVIAIKQDFGIGE